MSSTWLLDANVLIALAAENHTEHERACAWFFAKKRPFATCPITQGALIRFCMQFSTDKRISMVLALLREIVALPSHHFWIDKITYLQINTLGITGHRQVTDAYLVALAKHYHGILATMDEGLVAVHRNDVELLPPQ